MKSEFHLMRFLRKNNRQIMAIVVVLIMFAFIMPQVIQRWSHPGIKPTAAIAHFGLKSTISNADIENARGELAVLTMLGADQYLRSRPAGGFMQQSPDVPSLLLAQLFFPDQRISAMVSEEIKKAAKQGGLRATDGQIDEFFEQVGQEKPELYWILLRGEAREHGIAVSQEYAGAMLKSMVPQMTENKATAEQLLGEIMKRQNIEEETALQIFADMLAITKYVNTITHNEDITSEQVKFDILAQMQTLDANAVVIGADKFVEKVEQPSDKQVEELFNKYKGFYAGEFGAENPYGFGYKQPARAQLEYAVVNMEDVEKLIPDATSEQTEEFYQRNLSYFKYEEPTDPNDPNSKKIEKTRSYAEVATNIAEHLRRTSVNERAQTILGDVREIADANFLTVDMDKITLEEAAKLATSYGDAAKIVAARYNVRISTGKTGLLTANDIEQNMILGQVGMAGQGRSQTRLPQIVFAIPGLGGKLGPFEAVKPRIYESMGPLVNYMQQPMLMVRVIGIEKAHTPEKLDLTIAKGAPVDVNGTIQDSGDVYVLKNVVVADAKKVAAEPMARQAAEAFIKDIPQKGWEAAIADLNKQFGASKDPNFPTFSIQPLSGIRRISRESILMAKRQAAEMPGREAMASMYIQQKELVDKLFGLIGASDAEAKGLPQMVESKGAMSFYIVKTLGQTLVSKEQFEQMKPQVTIMSELMASQSLGLNILKPDNILKRLNFKWDTEKMGRPVNNESMPQDDVI